MRKDKWLGFHAVISENNAASLLSSQRRELGLADCLSF